MRQLTTLFTALTLVSILGCGSPSAKPPATMATVTVAQSIGDGQPADTKPAGAQRRPMGNLAGTEYVLDLQANRVDLFAASKEGGHRLVATVPVTAVHPQVWTHLWPGGIALMITPNNIGPGGKLYRIDPVTGKVTDLDGVMGPLSRMALQVSSDGRYLAWKLSGFNVPLEIIDLATGHRAVFDAEAHPMAGPWAPEAAVLAARAAEPGSGLLAQIGAQYWDGGSHIDLITTSGEVTHLRPPKTLQLVYGPVWSPDGKWLAVSAGSILAVGQGPGGASKFEPKELWLVEVAANRWIRAGSMTPDDRLTTWPRHLSEWMIRKAPQP